jgi:TonB-linked SusC/RagA family outer membrane protein
VDLNRQVSIYATDKDIKEILNQLFAGTDNIYFLNDRQIVIGEAQVDKADRILASVDGNSYLNLQQPRKNEVSGKVTDTEGDPLPGVTITILGTSRGVITADDGTFKIETEPSDRLVFSFVGMESQIIDVGAQNTINVEMEEKVDELEEVTVVAFGKQKKESVISSIETIKADELRVPSSNLTTAFAGRMAGVISYQTSGEPGQDNAEFFIRGVTSFGTGKVGPLILIDNVEMTTDDLSRMHPDDIASFSILKDATGTALYGARAANGVILITTKEGVEGKIKVSVRVENSFSMPTKEVEMADPITYMRMANEAAKTRDPLAGRMYSNEKIDNTIRGTNPYVYPSTDWMDELFTDVAINQKANLNISGGGKIAQYYIAGSVTQDNGILKVDKRNNFNSNIDLKKYLMRSNITINLTNTTKAKVRLHGTFEDYSGPIPGGNQLYQNALNVSPVRFPPYFEPSKNFDYKENILFGNDDGNFLNPYADMVSGYRERSSSVMLAQFELEQDFSNWIDGLTARALGNTIRNSFFDLSRSYNPFYYEISSYDRLSDEYFLREINTEQGTDYLSYSPGEKRISSSFYGELSAAYNQTFNQHGVSGMLVLIARNSLNANAPTLTESLPARNLGLSGRFTYDYDGRYLTEFNFGYNGSEKFDKGHRWGFFPSIGLGWMVSNEKFWAGIDRVFSKLKIKGTYGMIGNDNIGAERFFYLSNVNIGGGNNFTTGLEFNGKNRSGVSINNYSNPEIGWEISYKTNLGIEMGFFEGKVDLIADIFHEHRTNILQPRADIPVEMGLWAIPQANIGEATGRGVDFSLDYNQRINDLWFTGRATFTYARSEFSYYEEPDYSDVPWRSRIGMPISQRWGYVAERLFIDEADILNAPRQDFGEYRPGDIKYKDISGDGVINELDMVPIGYPTRPEINFGFGLSAGYKNWDASFFFQGSGNSSFWIDAAQMSPFARSGQLETGLAKFIADDYWSETSQNPFAGWPRLSNYRIANNNQRNTMFMQNGSFLRLKSVEMGYSLPKSVINTINIDAARFYFSGTNLLLFSKFDLWDVEMGGNGLGYPLQKVFNIGLHVSF